MNSSPNAALSLQDSLDDDAEARAQLASTNPANWRRALLQEPKRRAKTIPLRDTYAANHVPTVILRNEDGVIAEQNGAFRNSVHGVKFVQPPYRPNALQQRILLELNEVEFTPASKIAKLVRVSPGTARNELEKLAAKQFVVGEGFRGYRLAGKR